MTKTGSASRPSYWKADTFVTRVMSRFDAATEAASVKQQRSAFYRLIQYQARTLRILHTAIGSSNEPLTQAALGNFQVLHRALMAMHHRAPDVLPLPLLITEQLQEYFTSDLIMRLLKESGTAMTTEQLLDQLRDLHMLGPLAEEDIADNLDRLARGRYVLSEEGRYSATSRTYTEIDMNMRWLRAQLPTDLYENLRAAGFRRLSHVLDRPVQFQTTFCELTGLTEPETVEAFFDVVSSLYWVSLETVRPWHFYNVVDSWAPRPYQRDAYTAFRRAGYDCNIIEAPTGSGKTLIGMMNIADTLRTLQPGQSILVLVPTASYQQQWLAELCFSGIGLQLSPEIVFTGSPAQLEDFIRRTGQHPAIVLLTYTGVSQLASGVGKGGFDVDSLEMFIQESNIQYVLLDEVHKVVADMGSVCTDVTRTLVEWRQDNSIRGLIGFSGTVASYGHRFEKVGLDLIHTVPMDDLIAAGFVAPFAELGVPTSNSAREQRIRELLEQLKSSLRDFFAALGGSQLRAWFAEVPMAERIRIGHDQLGMYRGRKDWEAALTARFRDWEEGKNLSLPEANLALIVQVANGWSDAQMWARAELPAERLHSVRADVQSAREELLVLTYLPQTRRRLQVPGFMTALDTEALESAAKESFAPRRTEATKDALAGTLTGLYTVMKSWYLHVGEGRVETIKAVIEAERSLREITGTIVFSAGNRIRWRDGVTIPGYAGLGGLFAQMLGDQRFTVLAALSSELYMSYDEKSPLPEQVADFIDEELLRGESARAILNLAVQGLGLDPAVEQQITTLLRARLDAFMPSLRSIGAPRPAAFHQRVIRPVARHVEAERLGVPGDRLLSRLQRSNEHLSGLVDSFFDYAMIAQSMRRARPAELEQVSGRREKFFVVPMPSNNRRKQRMYELTSRIVDSDTLRVNLIIVSSWARTGWNVISPNLLIDATATADVTAWQQLRGRALRADRQWTNDCYRLQTLILGQDVLAFSDDESEQGDDRIAEELGDPLHQLLEEIATPDQVKRITSQGFHVLPDAERAALATALMRERNKVTHIYELVKASGSTRQVIYDRRAEQWRRKDAIAAKHARETAVNPLTGVKTQGEGHAPMVYVEDPRSDLPAALQKRLTADLANADERIVRGWLGLSDVDAWVYPATPASPH